MDGEIDLASWGPAYFSDPHPFLARLREQSPACPVVVDGLRAWLVTRHDDVRQALADPRLSNSPLMAGEAARDVPWVHARDASPVVLHMLRRDPPDHTRLRRLVSRAFTPRRIEALRPRVQRLADDLLAGLLPRGRCDLVDDFALPLPFAVIAGLLGVPRGDWDQFADWVHVYAGTDPGDIERTPLALGHLRDYLTTLIDRRQEMTGDADAGTLIDGLIATSDEGGHLDETELLSMIFLLLAAGYETTANMIGNATLALLRNRDQLALLRADPRLVGPAVEELLRYDGPVKELPALRFTTAELPVGEVIIPGGGEVVLLSLAAADRDPACFADADRLDIRRNNAGAHMAFGHGVHFCLGAQLARMEVTIAIRTLVERCEGLALTVEVDELEWRHSRVMRGLKHLPVTFTPVASQAAER